MNLTRQIAKHLRDVHFGGNWTASNMKDALAGLTWQQATTSIANLNSIAQLTFHSTYYVAALLDVLQGKPLAAEDQYSFDFQPIQSQNDWEQLKESVWTNASEAALLLEQLPDTMLTENFTDEKYGSYYRNIQGNIEHIHYHLGQIVLIRKMLLEEGNVEQHNLK